MILEDKTKSSVIFKKVSYGGLAKETKPARDFQAYLVIIISAV